MNPSDIAIVISSFNRFSLLKESIEVLCNWLPFSLYKNRIVIIVYDAGSTDGSIEWLTKKTNDNIIPIEVIYPLKNSDTSFSAGLNTAVLHAETKYRLLKYLLFYETDNQILSERPITSALSQLDSRDNLAACGFTVRKHNGKDAGVGMPFPTLVNFALGKNFVNYFQLERIPYQWQIDSNEVSYSEVDVVYTSPLLVKLKAWQESGAMDSQLFPFADCDIDWAYRLRKLQWHMGVIRTDEVIHDNRELLSDWSKSRALQFHRARLRYFHRYKPFMVFTVWPIILVIRHSLEFFITKIIVRDNVRRKQLSEQFLSLLKFCINKYEY